MTDELVERLEDMGAEVEDSIDRLMGDEDLYMQFLSRLKDNENIVNLRKAVDEKDSKRAEREVHTLKGVALNLGLLPLADVCMDMLLDIREGNLEKAYAQIDQVEAVFSEWVQAIGE